MDMDSGNRICKIENLSRDFLALAMVVCVVTMPIQSHAVDISWSRGMVIRKKPDHHIVIGTDPVQTVHFSPMGKTIAAGVWDKNNQGKLVLWDVETGHQKNSFETARGPISSFSFSPDERVIAWASSFGSDVNLWKPSTNLHTRLSVRNGLPGDAISVAFLPGGDRIVAVYSDGAVRVWDVMKQTLWQTFHQNADGVGLRETAVSGDGQIVAIGPSIPDNVVSGRRNQDVELWDVRRAKMVGVLRCGRELVSAIDFAPCEPIVAIGQDDGTVALWDIKTE